MSDKNNYLQMFSTFEASEPEIFKVMSGGNIKKIIFVGRLSEIFLNLTTKSWLNMIINFTTVYKFQFNLWDKLSYLPHIVQNIEKINSPRIFSEKRIAHAFTQSTGGPIACPKFYWFLCSLPRLRFSLCWRLQEWWKTFSRVPHEIIRA